MGLRLWIIENVKGLKPNSEAWVGALSQLQRNCFQALHSVISAAQHGGNQDRHRLYMFAFSPAFDITTEDTQFQARMLRAFR